MPPNQDAKKVVDTVLGQLAGLTKMPNTEAGQNVINKVPEYVQKLAKFLPDLEELKATKKHTSMVTEKDLKDFLGKVADTLNGAVEIVKIGKALQKSWGF